MAKKQTMTEKLIQTLGGVGKPTELYRNPDGSTVLILPYGGRILGLFAPESDENFYWTHPALESVSSSLDFYESDQWHNSGGDRTWLSPEVDVFFPNFPNTEKYWQPRQLDPGQYQVVKTDRGLRLNNRLKVTLSRSKQEVELRITKSVAPAPNPLRYERTPTDLAGAQYAGYTLHTSLELENASAEVPAPVGLWNLVQMPHGGELLIPTYVRTNPSIYFGSIDREDLIVGDHLVRYRMRASGEQKIGIRAVATPGRVGYVYPARDGRWALIIRNFFVNPSGQYIDVPWDDTKDLGYSTQACNINSDLGSFSELEYHVPAIGHGTGHTRCEDVAQVWAFRGSRQEIDSIIKSLLTSEQ